jgi:hypothetical protein
MRCGVLPSLHRRTPLDVIITERGLPLFGLAECRRVLQPGVRGW